MIDDWLEFNARSDNDYVFKIIHVTEKRQPDDELVEYLKNEIISSYRTIELYKFHLENASRDEIRDYVKNQVIPKDENQFDRNVRQGDWGEVLAGLIVMNFQNLEIPINKLQWKFNKNKAVFGTDLIAFNQGDEIEEIYYYEIKTRQNPDKKEGESPDRNYITVLAHHSLLKDEQSPTESIANFLEQLYFFKGDYKSAAKFKDIIKNPQKYNRKFELFLIIERGKFMEDILHELHELPPQLDPLNVTIVLIDNLGDLVNNTWQDIEESLVKLISK